MFGQTVSHWGSEKNCSREIGAFRMTIVDASAIYGAIEARREFLKKCIVGSGSVARNEN